MIPLTLLAYARLDTPALYLSAYFERHRQRYVDLMLAATKRGEFEPWILFFLEAIRDSRRDRRWTQAFRASASGRDTRCGSASR
jgi:Fic family protein